MVAEPLGRERRGLVGRPFGRAKASGIVQGCARRRETYAGALSVGGAGRPLSLRAGVDFESEGDEGFVDGAGVPNSNEGAGKDVEDGSIGGGFMAGGGFAGANS